MTSRRREYAVTVFKHWGRQISGPIVAVVAITLAALAHRYPNSPWLSPAAAYGTGAVALLLVLEAQYQAWLEERKRRELEERKNSQPELRFSIGEFTSGFYNDGRTGEDVQCSVRFKCTLSVTNHNTVATNVVKVEMDGSALDPHVEFHELAISFAPARLEHGLMSLVGVKGLAAVEGHATYDVGAICLTGLVIYLVDGFGNRHAATITDRALLNFAPRGVDG